MKQEYKLYRKKALEALREKDALIAEQAVMLGGRQPPSASSSSSSNLRNPAGPGGGGGPMGGPPTAMLDVEGDPRIQYLRNLVAKYLSTEQAEVKRERRGAGMGCGLGENRAGIGVSQFDKVLVGHKVGKYWVRLAASLISWFNVSLCGVQIREPTERAICTVLRFSDDEMTKIKVHTLQEQNTHTYTIHTHALSSLPFCSSEADMPFSCVMSLGGSWVSRRVGDGAVGPSRQPLRVLLLMTTRTEGLGGAPIAREEGKKRTLGRRRGGGGTMTGWTGDCRDRGIVA